MEEDHTASLINALAHFQPPPIPDHLNLSLSLQSLDQWSVDDLKLEVIRLRRTLRAATQLSLDSDSAADAAAAVAAAATVPDAILQQQLANLAQSAQQQQAQSQQSFSVNQPPQSLPHQPPHSQQHAHAPTPTTHTSQLHPTPPHHHTQTAPSAASQQGQLSQAPPNTTPRKRTLSDSLDGRPSSSHNGAPTSRRKPSKRDEGTGKRVEKGRRVELARAIRTKMRFAMNIGLDDDLPPPTVISAPEAQPDNSGYWVPNWPAGVSDPLNSQWLDRVCAVFIAEARTLQAWTKVPQEDLDEDIVKTAARTAFQNFAKRYLAEVDPKQAKKKEKYVKNRRRWARKDLKQKRRAKAAADPSFADVFLPPSALHIDYMSSEYSSAGEEDDEDPIAIATTARRREHWIDILRQQTPPDLSGKNGGKGGWAEGVSEKVLEVRTPTWRSARLDEIYRRLDQISGAQAAMRATPASQQGISTLGSNTSSITNPPPNLRLGHVAPSHKRFTLPRELMRHGHAPRDAGEPWMWASGETGVWPPSNSSPIGLGVSIGVMGNEPNSGVGYGNMNGISGVNIMGPVPVMGNGHVQSSNGQGLHHPTHQVSVDDVMEAARVAESIMDTSNRIMDGRGGVGVGVDSSNVDVLVERWTDVS